MAPMETTAAPAAETETGLAHGVWAPVLTPVDEDLAPDAGRFIALARSLLADGCHGIVVFGTTGEANSFSVDERMALLDATLEAGIAPERIIVGTGLCALSDTVRLTAHAVAAGCAGALVLPPFYFKNPSEDGLVASYSEVIERVGESGLKLYFYHFPKLSTVPITPGLIARMRDACPSVIAGVKDSTGDAENTAMLCQTFPDLAIFPGTETLQLDMLRLGGAGTITAGANLNPAGNRAVYDAFRAGDLDAAQSLQDKATAIRRAMEGAPFAPGLKYILARLHNDPGWARVRPPFVPLAEEAGAALWDAIAAAGFDLSGGRASPP